PRPDHGPPDVPPAGTAETALHPEDIASYHHRPEAERPLACRSHNRAHRARLLGRLGSLRLASGLAFLLVGGRGHRPLLAARHGIRGLPWPAIVSCRSWVPGA